MLKVSYLRLFGTGYDKVDRIGEKKGEGDEVRRRFDGDIRLNKGIIVKDTFYRN